jgi:hypothetical protein
LIPYFILGDSGRCEYGSIRGRGAACSPVPCAQAFVQDCFPAWRRNRYASSPPTETTSWPRELRIKTTRRAIVEAKLEQQRVREVKERRGGGRRTGQKSARATRDAERARATGRREGVEQNRMLTICCSLALARTRGDCSSSSRPRDFLRPLGP